MAIALEDNFEDVVSKAARGLGLSTRALCDVGEVDRDALKVFLGGRFDEGLARRLAGPLNLDAGALVELGKGAWQPEEVQVDGLSMFTSEFHGMLVNAYVVRDPGSRLAAVFDSGSDAAMIVDRVRADDLEVSSIFLTHTHPDHIACVDELSRELDCPIWVGDGESCAAGIAFAAGTEFSIGGLPVETRLTRGHSAGGISYIIRGLSRPVAIVGDALFAGSMGGGMVSYMDALETNRKELFSLEDEAVICPGHGPMSSIWEERKHNPFFAGRL